MKQREGQGRITNIGRRNEIILNLVHQMMIQRIMGGGGQRRITNIGRRSRMILNPVCQKIQRMIERGGQRKRTYIRTRSEYKIVLNPVHQTILMTMRRGGQRKMTNIGRGEIILNPVQIIQGMMGRGQIRFTIIGRREIATTTVHQTTHSLIGITKRAETSILTGIHLKISTLIGIIEVNTIIAIIAIIIPIITDSSSEQVPILLKPYS